MCWPLPPQDEQDDSRCSQAALQERLAQLQAVCLELDSQAAAGVGGGASADAGLVAPLLTGGGGQVQLLEQLLGTLRVLGPASGSSPPPVASSKEQAAAKGLRIDLRLALREQEGLRRERDGLAAKLRAAEAQVGGWAGGCPCVDGGGCGLSQPLPMHAVPAGSQAASSTGGPAADPGAGAARGRLCHCRAAAAAESGKGQGGGHGAIGGRLGGARRHTLCAACCQALLPH